MTNDSLHIYTWDANGRPVTADGVTLTYDAVGRMVENNVGVAVLPEHARLFRGPAVMTMLRRRQAIELRWKRVVDRVYANAGKN